MSSDDAIRTAVVKIIGFDDAGEKKLWGTGVLIAPGVVMTCAHVVANHGEQGWERDPRLFCVIDSDGNEHPNLEEMTFHRSLDLARFEVSGLVQQPHRELLPFEPSAGEPCRLYGFPRLAECGHWGFITIQGVLDDGLLQCDMNWAGAGTKSEDVTGASGSPLLQAGKVIGFFVSVQRKGETVVAQRAHGVCVKQALKQDADFFADYVNPEPLEQLLMAQYGMRRRHVFGNIPLKDVAGNIPQMPLEDIYVQPMAIRVPVGRQNVVGETRPALDLVTELLSSCHLVAIDQGFGSGKSLTARTLVWQLSRNWLESESKEDEYLPILIRCADTMYLPNGGAITSFLGGGVSGLTALLGCGDANITLADIKHRKKVVWVLDGLDELALPANELSTFYFMLRGWFQNNTQHRFVVTARTTVAQKALDSVSNQSWVETSVARLALHYFDADQRSQWLSRWVSILTSPSNANCEIKPPDDERLVQDELYKVPLLLFMGAISGSDDGTPRSKAVLYEHFCTWVAVGKWHEQINTNTPAGAGLKRLAALTDAGPHAMLKPSQKVGGVTREEELRRGISHALYILSRLAWESVGIEQRKRWSGEESQHDHDALPLSEVEKLLSELGYLSEENSAKADRLVLNTVLLNAMGTKQGGTSNFLFGHKSFREYLAVRYHLSIFLYMAENNIRSSKPSEFTLTSTLLEAIGRGDLLDYSEATREFVSDVRSLPQLKGRTKALHDWCMAEVSDPSIISPRGELVCLQTDLRASWRFSCLGIRAAMLGSDEISPVSSTQAMSELFAAHRIRSNYSRRAGNGLIASKLDFSDSMMRGVLFDNANLTWSKFTRANLTSANFEDADLFRARLEGADLENASLTRANLEQANLEQANLVAANLTNARLIGALLKGADLSSAHLVAAKLNGANLTNANLFSARLTSANLEDANFFSANLTNANLEQANLENATFDEANLTNAILFRARLGGASLISAELGEANLSFANLAKANLNGANLASAKLNGADLARANLAKANLNGANLEETNILSANLNGAYYDEKTQWPAYTNPSTKGAILKKK